MEAKVGQRHTRVVKSTFPVARISRKTLVHSHCSLRRQVTVKTMNNSLKQFIFLTNFTHLICDVCVRKTSTLRACTSISDFHTIVLQETCDRKPQIIFPFFVVINCRVDAINLQFYSEGGEKPLN